MGLGAVVEPQDAFRVFALPDQGKVAFHQPPMLAIWGSRNPFFLPAGAEAFKRDNPQAEVRFLDTGHFAIETHGAEIAAAMLAFLARSIGS